MSRRIRRDGVAFQFEPPWREVFGMAVADNPDFLVDPAGVRAVAVQPVRGEPADGQLELFGPMSV